jgi:hypothetical protein
MVPARNLPRPDISGGLVTDQVTRPKSRGFRLNRGARVLLADGVRHVADHVGRDDLPGPTSLNRRGADGA